MSQDDIIFEAEQQMLGYRCVFSATYANKCAAEACKRLGLRRVFGIWLVSELGPGETILVATIRFPRLAGISHPDAANHAAALEGLHHEGRHNGR